MSTKPTSDDITSMLQKMQHDANQKLSELDSEIAATHAKITAQRKVGYTDCVNAIVERIKAQRDEDLDALDTSMGIFGVLRGHQALSSFNLHSDGSSSISAPSKYVFSAYDLAQKNIDRALLTDQQILAYAQAAAKRFGCMETTPGAATLAGDHEISIQRLKKLHDQKLELNRRVASLMFAQSEAMAMKATDQPGQPDPTKPIVFNDGKFVMLPESPHATKVTITVGGQPQ